MDEKRQRMLDVARQETWIKTPFSYVDAGRKLTLLQQDTMLMVSAHVQEYIKRFFDLGLGKSKERPRSLFAQHLLTDGIPPFRIYLEELGISTANYKVVREAIEEMNLLVEHPELDAEGRPTTTTIFSPVFKRFRVPQTGDYYRKRDAEGEVIVASARHYGYIEVEINNDVAQYAFDMSQGYATHPKFLARYASKRSTPRLYFLLQEKMGEKRSSTVRLTVQEVKNYLGFETFKDARTGEWVVPYAKFAHFKTKILDAVQHDMDAMAAKDHSDITFTYQPVYNGGRRRGDPDYLEFHIVSTDLGLGYGLMTGTQTPAVVEARERESAKARQLELFEQQELEREQRLLQTWHDCQQDLLALTTRDDSRTLVAAVRFESFSDRDRLLTLQLPSQSAYDLLEQPAVIQSVLQPTLEKHFGRGVKLQYRMLTPTSP